MKPFLLSSRRDDELYRFAYETHRKWVDTCSNFEIVGQLHDEHRDRETGSRVTRTLAISTVDARWPIPGAGMETISNFFIWAEFTDSCWFWSSLKFWLCCLVGSWIGGLCSDLELVGYVLILNWWAMFWCWIGVCRLFTIIFICSSLDVGMGYWQNCVLLLTKFKYL